MKAKIIKEKLLVFLIMVLIGLIIFITNQSPIYYIIITAIPPIYHSIKKHKK